MPTVKRGAIALLFPALLVLLETAAQAQVGLATFSSSQSGVRGYIAILDLGSGSFTPVVSELDTTCRGAGNGLLANPGQTNGPVLYFTSRTQAGITSGLTPSGVQWAVAGSTNTNNDCPDLYEPGTLLVAGGGAGRCPIPKSRVPAGRGAVGLDASGRFLIVVVVQGTDSGGMVTADLAQVLIALKAVDAVNFDGGGSTSFHWNPAAASSLPSISTEAQDMILHAAYPPNLHIAVTPFSPQDLQSYDADPSRLVYGSLGFTFTPPTHASRPR